MPPMKAAAKKAPGKPSAPKKPTSRSKTGNSACSQAASNWQLAIRGKAPLDPDTYKTLGKCRAMARAAKSADGRAAAGYNLSEQGRDAIKGRLQKRFDQGLITQKSRDERLKTLLQQRKAKQAAVTAKPADENRRERMLDIYKIRKENADVRKEDKKREIDDRLYNAVDNAKRYAPDHNQYRPGGALNNRGSKYGMLSPQDMAKRQAAAEKIRAARKEHQATPEVQAKIARQDAVARERTRKKFSLFGGQLPDERPHIGVTTQPAAKQYSPVSRPSVDHSFLSPSGRVSKRSKEWAIKKTSETLFGPGGMPHPQLPKQPTEQESLRRQAAELRDMASRGLKPRAYKKKADELEAKANSLDLPPAPAPAPAKFSRGGQLAPGRGTEERKNQAAYKTALRSGAIPLSMKPDKIPRGFEATLASGYKGGKIVTVTKPVKGSDYAAVQVNDYGSSGKYILVDPKSGKTYGGGYSTVKDAETVAKKVDRLVKRASRGLPQNTSVEKIVKTPGKEGYIGFIMDTVLGRNRKRK